MPAASECYVHINPRRLNVQAIYALIKQHGYVVGWFTHLTSEIIFLLSKLTVLRVSPYLYRIANANKTYCLLYACHLLIAA